MNVPKHHRQFPQRYRMEAGKCKKCGYIAFPPRLICPECGHEEFEIQRLAGTGKLLTHTIIRIAPEGFEDFTPYAIGLVALEEGINVLGQITDCNPEDLKTGDALVTKFRRMNEEGKTGMIMYSYKFVPQLGI